MKKLSSIFVKILFICSFLISCATAPDRKGMEILDTPVATIYHEQENPTTLVEIVTLLTHCKERAEVYFEQEITPRKLIIYKNQRKLQRQKYGFLTDLLKLDWYIGDNIGETALIVSPNTRVKGHDYYSILHAIPHEYIHTIIYAINPHCPLWINEGLALYLSNGSTDLSVSQTFIPPLRIFTNQNPLYFAQHNGYAYADKFIEFIEKSFGKEMVLRILKSGKIEEETGKPLSILYEEWKNFLYRQYP